MQRKETVVIRAENTETENDETKVPTKLKATSFKTVCTKWIKTRMTPVGIKCQHKLHPGKIL